jgi:hypothetical protein
MAGDELIDHAHGGECSSPPDRLVDPDARFKPCS